MDRYKNTEAIVINHHHSKEQDLLVTFLTPYDGKIVALAKGVKNIKSSRLGSLQLGNIIKVHLYQKNDFLWVSESKSIDHFLQNDKNLTQLNLLFYFLEIANRLIAENQHIDDIYSISKNIIKSINNNQIYSYIKNEILFIKTLGFGLPEEIVTAFNQKKYRNCQQLIKQYFESIIEKPLESNKLFK